MESSHKATLSPLVKWTGGKTRELPEIRARMPKGFTRYLEPFLGGGAVLWDMPASIPAMASDASADLVCLWHCWKAYGENFRSSLRRVEMAWEATSPQAAALALTEPGDGAAFLLSESIRAAAQARYQAACTKVFPVMASQERIRSGAVKSAAYTLFREAYNAMAPACPSMPSPHRAALFWAIRELAYGGMFRTNAAGGFNVPYGGWSYDSRKLSNKFNLPATDAYSGRLAATEVMYGDFSQVMDQAAPGDFMFLDPPYDSPFSGYDGNAFGREQHIRFAESLSMQASRGVKWLMVVGWTEFTEGLYGRLDGVWSDTFDRKYSGNIKNRYSRKATHLCLAGGYVPGKHG